MHTREVKAVVIAIRKARYEPTVLLELEALIGLPRGSTSALFEVKMSAERFGAVMSALNGESPFSRRCVIRINPSGNHAEFLRWAEPEDWADPEKRAAALEGRRGKDPLRDCQESGCPGVRELLCELVYQVRSMRCFFETSGKTSCSRPKD